ncbi:hypothetical protein LJR289_000500 [Pseudoduganella sp. LjRoot289]|uniref:hypothetical protein n=1 Tax=Pseudoduganella sp. LjRoot289 TaxID=3342314 RepID=UPI003ED0BECC
MEYIGTTQAQQPEPRLQPLLTAHAAPLTPLNAVYSAERLLPHRASVFIEFIAGVFAAAPGLAIRPASQRVVQSVS